MPQGERRLVSVLFADLVGFTTLSESRDVEEVRELLSRYFDTCRRLITRYGGTVEKFIGDAVMAVWGTPVAMEDDAERAVRAALELVDAVTALGAEVGAPDLRARAGVLTGEAAVMLGGDSEGMVAGDLVNTASRVQSAAQPGTVFVGDSTRRSTEAAIVYEPAGTHTLKGKAEPMELWRAVRVIAGIGGNYKPSGLEPPFVGRDRELRQVKDLFHASVEGRKAHLVSVIGIAGIGKSRLAWEFFKYVEGLADLIRWHRGRCLSYGEGVSYWALAEMVRMRAQIVEGEEQTSAAQKLHATVEQYVPDADERKWIEPRLAHLLGLEDRAARDSEDLFAAWRVFFERLAEEKPVVMVFEDMQWADAGLIDFIEYLTSWSRNYPIFVMTSGRPEFLERHPDWGAGKRAFTSLYLEPLSRDVMQEMLDGLVPGLGDEVRSKILERAEGVPLYAVETVRMLLDKGLLEAQENAYRVTGPIETLEVPETLHALIAARLDGLNEQERRAIQDASVLGKTFTAESVAALAGLSQAETDEILGALVRKEVLALQTDFRSPERGQYGFLQDLVRRVAYETMSKKERKARHLAAAHLLEESCTGDEDENVEVLASHYLEAYRAAPEASDAVNIKALARAALVGAAKRAGSLAASQDARRYYEQALELSDEDAESARLHEGAGQMSWLSADLAGAKEHAEAARDMYERLHDDRGVARASVINADVLRYQGRLEDAISILKAALGVLEDDPDESTAMLAERIGRALLFTGHLSEALEMVERALTMGEKMDFPSVMSQALNTKSLVLTALTRPQEGILLLRHSLQIALENDLGEAALRAYNNIGAIMNERDQHQLEYESSSDGLELARKLGNRPWEEGMTIGKMTPCLYLGRWDECLTVRDEAVQLGIDFSGSAFSAEWLMIVPVHVWRGELDEARHLLTRSSLAEAEDLQVRQTWHAMNSLVSRVEGKRADAISSGDIAFSLRTEMGIRAPGTKEAFVQLMEASLDADDLAKADEVMGVVRGFGPGQVTPYQRAQYRRFDALIDATRGGDPSAGLREAIRDLAELRMPFWEAVVSTELAEWLLGQGRDAEAAPFVAQARATFEQLRATLWLERLDKSGALETLAQAT
ncbi:MAG TPA: adenylate/guanylate cyclase domain-containing protein [Actinomycetota bacterium]|nr:adenylate/guanylate cyclase domain-containing protein [Actinomycetota bacterium]